MNARPSLKALTLGTAVSALALASAWSQPASAAAPANIGGGLRQLIEEQAAAGPAIASEAGTGSAMAIQAPRLLRDAKGGVLINIYLDGTRPLAQVHQELAALGLSVSAEIGSFGKGVIAAYVPVEKAAAVANLGGVRALMLDHKPLLHVGKVTSQGVRTIDAQDVLAAGVKGAGITVAALSDSYNTYRPYPASRDIKTGDLPGPGNPYGDTKPVYVLQEDPQPGTDEGRALLQIIHDVAPKARLCYATAFSGELQFAINIEKLADRSGECRADVIDDDVSYFDEPFFSDGVVAQAVDQVATDGVVYTSSAGNENTGDYHATFDPVSDADARSSDAGNLDLSAVPKLLTAGGFHNFATDGSVAIAMPVSVPPGTHYIALQWNDPYNNGGNLPETASYSFLVFNENGKYLKDFSGIDNNFSTNIPLQTLVIDNDTAAAKTYQIVIAQRGNTGPGFADHLKWVDYDDGNQITLLQFAQLYAPSLVGHPAADGAIAVAADYWGSTANIENFSSLGPTEIDFDPDGAAYKNPHFRLKPEVSAPDGVSTTFFGSPVPDGNNTGFYFYGTSAAAPHVAGAAALLLQGAGGPKSLSPAAIKQALEATTQQPHQLKPGSLEATAVTGADTVSISVTGFSFFDPQQYRVSFDGDKGDTLIGLVLDAAPAQMNFERNTRFYYVGTTNIPPADIVYDTDANGPVAQFEFTNGAFVSGKYVHFTLAMYGFKSFYLQADSSLLAGTKVSAYIRKANGNVAQAHGVLNTPTGTGFSISDGFGLIDVSAASQMLAGSSPRFVAP